MVLRSPIPTLPFRKTSRALGGVTLDRLDLEKKEEKAPPLKSWSGGTAKDGMDDVDDDVVDTSESDANSGGGKRGSFSSSVNVGGVEKTGLDSGGLANSE